MYSISDDKKKYILFLEKLTFKQQNSIIERKRKKGDGYELY